MKDNEESMWDDYDYYQNTGEMSEYFEDDYNEEEVDDDGVRIDLSDPYLIDKLDAVIANLEKRNAEMEAMQQNQAENIPEPIQETTVSEPAEAKKPEGQTSFMKKLLHKLFGD